MPSGIPFVAAGVASRDHEPVGAFLDNPICLALKVMCAGRYPVSPNSARDIVLHRNLKRWVLEVSDPELRVRLHPIDGVEETLQRARTNPRSRFQVPRKVPPEADVSDVIYPFALLVFFFEAWVWARSRRLR
jgi:hypothetical protein